MNVNRYILGIGFGTTCAFILIHTLAGFTVTHRYQGCRVPHRVENPTPCRRAFESVCVERRSIARAPLCR